MVVVLGPDVYPHLGVRDVSSVRPNHQEIVDEDDLVAPIIFHPASQRP